MKKRLRNILIILGIVGVAYAATGQAQDVNVCFTIPSAQVDRTVDAVSYTYGYKDEICDAEDVCTPNPVSKNAFAKQQVMKWVKEVVKGYEVSLASETARADAIKDVEDNLNLQ